MKKTIVITLLLITTTVAFSQTNNTLGGAGICVVDQDPDNITDMQTQDTRYECMIAWNKVTQTVYVYDSTASSGSRWVTFQSTLPSVTNTNERLDNPRVAGANLVFDIIDRTDSDNITGTVSVAIADIAPVQSVTDGTTVDFTLTGTALTAEVIDASITPAKLDRTYLESEDDGSVTNEVNTSASWNDGTNTFTVTDSNGDVSAVITGFLESVTGSETAFDGWDKDASDDFDGAWSSLTSVPAGFADNVDDVDDADADPTNENQTVSAGTGITINQVGQDFEVVSDEATQGAYKNHSDAGVGGVSIGDFFYASTDNTMGVAPGSKIRRMY
jgi:hypothetical protein